MSITSFIGIRGHHALVALLALTACGKKVSSEDKKEVPTATEPARAPAGAPGVDLDKKVVRLGALNDESGPAKQIGVAFANGKRLLVKAVNEGTVRALPEGWKVELVEKDHGYNPQQSVQLYKEIKDSVLLVATVRRTSGIFRIA